jgi:hypothetical protein
MHRRQRIRRALAAAVLVAALPAAMPAQSTRSGAVGDTGDALYRVPRTAWGDPDIQGFWTNTTTTPLQRPADLAEKAVLTDAERAARDAQVAARASQDQAPPKGNPGTYNDFWYERGVLSNQTSLVVDPPDGRLPPLTDAAQQYAAERRKRGPADSPEERSVYERCITRGLPGAMMPGFYNHNYEIIQTPGYVVVHVEMIHEARIIPLDGRPRGPAAVRRWMGESRGRWDGDTLVVETSNFNDKVREQSLIAFSTGQHLTLVERFRRTAPDAMDYRFTVTDPTVYTRPWTASIPMARFEGPIYEYACHEGNHGLGGILRGARFEEREGKR